MPSRRSRSWLSRLLATAALVGFLTAGAAAIVAARPDDGRHGNVRPPQRERATAPARPKPERKPERQAAARAPIRWRRSRALGRPWEGRLVRGVQLPAEGRHFFTWDPILRRSPNRAWRRFATDRLVRVLLRIAAAHRRANPGAPRLAIGDLSRAHGGDFGRRYGLPGHVSHENGLDADVYYPRRDRRERPPARPSQIDRRLAQDLVDRFVRAGAVKVFVGPNTGLTGPRRIVAVLPAYHDNHMHVRIAAGG